MHSSFTNKKAETGLSSHILVSINIELLEVEYVPKTKKRHAKRLLRYTMHITRHTQLNKNPRVIII
jgi:hypothetical protein